jgi:thioredoxin reductase (NADPH)
MEEKVVILGSGPAGLTAAIYAARAKLGPLVIDGLQPGGQLMITTEVDNYPGFPEGVSGPELMERLRKQAERFDTRFKPGQVSGVDFSGGSHKIMLEGGEVIDTRTVIVATGASARWLGLESEQKLQGAGVSACATCDGFFFSGKEIAVVGGGDTAMEEATYLTHHASKVTVIHRRNELRASKYMQEAALKNQKIEFVWNSVVEEVLDVEQGRVTGVVLRDVMTDEKRTLPIEGLFIAIGHVPNTVPFVGTLDMGKEGYLITNPGTTHTSVAGVFAAGDVADARYRQGVSAAGTGCMAAIDAERYLGGEPPDLNRAV